MSRCFPVNNGLAEGGIQLNLIGRVPQGILEPGQEAKTFSDELTANLLNIMDERTSKPLVRRILRTADLYAGKHLDHLPDLLVEWSDEVPTGSRIVGEGAGAFIRASSPKIGVIEGSNDYCRTGEHRKFGLLIAAGPMVSPGEFTKEISLLDLAPTLARHLGVDLPDCDGRPLDELLECGPARGSIT